MKTVLKVAIGLVLGTVLLIAGSVALIGAGVDEADDDQLASGITMSQFRSMPIGSTMAEVRVALGRFEEFVFFEPVGTEGDDDFAPGISCAYYPQRRNGTLEGKSFQLCFTDGRLDSKRVQE